MRPPPRAGEVREFGMKPADVAIAALVAVIRRLLSKRQQIQSEIASEKIA
jgi:hypothetical protein